MNLDDKTISDGHITFLLSRVYPDAYSSIDGMAISLSANGANIPVRQFLKPCSLNCKRLLTVDFVNSLFGYAVNRLPLLV